MADEQTATTATETASPDTASPDTRTSTETQTAQDTATKGTETQTAEGKETKTEAPAEDLATLRKRLGDTQKWGNENAQKMAAMEKEIADLKAAAAAQPKPESAKPDFGDYAERLTALDALIPELETQWGADDPNSKVARQFADFAKGLAQEMRQFKEATAASIYAAHVTSEHPDHKEITASPEFNKWVDEVVTKDSVLLAALIEERDPRNLCTVLDKFKEFRTKGLTSEQRQRLDAAAELKKKATQAPSGATGQPTSTKTYTRDQIAQMAQNGTYAKHRDEILKAEREGRIK